MPFLISISLWDSTSLSIQFFAMAWTAVHPASLFVGILQARIMEQIAMPSYRKWGEVTWSCPTLCDPMDCNLPGSFVHGIFQARVLEWVAISFSRGSSQSRDWTWVSRIVGRCFTIWATREVPNTGIEPRSPALQADSVPSVLPGKQAFSNMWENSLLTILRM